MSFAQNSTSQPFRGHDSDLGSGTSLGVVMERTGIPLVLMAGGLMWIVDLWQKADGKMAVMTNPGPARHWRRTTPQPSVQSASHQDKTQPNCRLVTFHPHHNLFHPAMINTCVEIPWNRKASDLQVASIPAPRAVHQALHCLSIYDKKIPPSEWSVTINTYMISAVV